MDVLPDSGNWRCGHYPIHMIHIHEVDHARPELGEDEYYDCHPDCYESDLDYELADGSHESDHPDFNADC